MIAIYHGQFYCGNKGHTQNTDSPYVKSFFPMGKRSSGTTTNENQSDGRTETIDSNIVKSSQSNALFPNSANQMFGTKQ